MVSRLPQLSKDFKLGLNLETGTYIFALFNTLLSLLASVTSGAFIIYITTMVLTETNKRDHYYYYREWMRYFAIMVPVTTCSFMAYAFSGFLLRGVMERKAELIKIYFVYGVILNMLTASTSFSWMVLGDPYYAYFGIIAFVLCMQYSMVLIMVQRTYTVYEEEKKKVTKSTNHHDTQPLLGNDNLNFSYDAVKTEIV